MISIDTLQLSLSSIGLFFTIFGTLAIWLLNGIKSELKELKAEIKDNQIKQDKLKEENFEIKSDIKLLKNSIETLPCFKANECDIKKPIVPKINLTASKNKHAKLSDK